MKVLTDSRTCPLSYREYIYITYLAEPDQDETEEGICLYIETKHGADTQREVIYDHDLKMWGRKILIIKQHPKPTKAGKSAK